MNSLQGPTHTLTHHQLQNRSKHCTLLYHGIHSSQSYRSKISVTLKTRIWLPCLQNFSTHTRQFQIGQPTPSKTTHAFPHSPLLTNWKFEPSPRTHTHSDLIYRSKTLYYTEKYRFGYPWLPKKFQSHHQNLLKLSPVSERSAYPLQNYICFPRSPLD